MNKTIDLYDANVPALKGWSDYEVELTPETLLAQQLEEIKSLPIQLFMAITGGGSTAIGELLKDQGGSNILVGAYVPYSASALEEYLGNEVFKACSLPIAHQLAHKARSDAYRHNKSEKESVGLGVTASLYCLDQRLDRVNEAFIVMKGDLFVIEQHHIFTSQSRVAQEKELQSLILAMLYRLTEKPDNAFDYAQMYQQLNSQS
jgi:hypothetical protein